MSGEAVILVGNKLPTPAEFGETFARLEREIGNVVVGHREALRQILVAFFAGGHVLIEGVPGIGKTLIVRSLGEALDLAFARAVHHRPDAGGHHRHARVRGERERTARWCSRPVAVHAHHARRRSTGTPKTQSALLEAMAELQVTVAGTTHRSRCRSSSSRR
jgi:MoxR-like ATPase